MKLEYFYSENAPYVDVLSWPHLVYLLLCAVAIFFFVRSHKTIRENREQVGRIMLGIILFQQIFLMYGWYLLTSSDLLKNALPLEMCRVSTILTIIFLITKDNRFMDVIFYFSIYALASLFYPKNVYHFLHVNGLSYMINHLMTVLAPIFGAIAYGWKPSWKAFARAVVSFSVFLPVVIVVNRFTGGNYFYLVDRPFWNDLPAPVFIGITYVGTVAGFALVTWSSDLILEKVSAKRKIPV